MSSNRYTASHQDPNGPGDARPTALQIVQDENMQGKLKGKVVLVTGTSSGIGRPTVEAMAATGATVFCAARDIEKNKHALCGIPGEIEHLQLDLSSFASVRTAAAEFLQRANGRLNILINNAGVMAIQQQTLSVDGYEMQFATNHLGHFLLFQLLKSALLDSSSEDFPSRVINLSSAGHRFSPVHFGNYNLDGEYTPNLGYGQSKTANIYMTTAIERHYGQKGLHGIAVHPGGIWTELARHMPKEAIEGFQKVPGLSKAFKSPEQGAATTILAAIGSEYHGKGGLYLEDCGEWGKNENPTPTPGKRGYVAWAFNAENEEKLWKDSCEIVGVEE